MQVIETGHAHIQSYYTWDTNSGIVATCGIISEYRCIGKKMPSQRHNAWTIGRKSPILFVAIWYSCHSSSVRRMYHISQTGHVFENEVLCWYCVCVCVMCIHWQLLVYRYCCYFWLLPSCCRAVAYVAERFCCSTVFVWVGYRYRW